MPQFESTNETYRDSDFLCFRVGTVNGLWRLTPTHYEILAVVNHQKGNGHFKKAMWWFEQSCRRDGKKLMLREIWNIQLLLKCRKMGYTLVPGTLFTYEKAFV